MSCIQVKPSPRKHFPKYVKSESEECFQCRFIHNCLLISAFRCLTVWFLIPQQMPLCFWNNLGINKRFFGQWKLMEVCEIWFHQLSSLSLTPSLLGQNVELIENWEFIISNLIISVILSNTANHWNPLWNLTNIPLGPANTPHTVFSSGSNQALAPVGIFGVIISTNEERDAEEQILAIPKPKGEQTQPFPLFQLLCRARVCPKPANFTWSPGTSWFPTLGEALWMWRWSNADSKLLEDLI